jgi:hypothetical protein
MEGKQHLPRPLLRRGIPKKIETATSYGACAEQPELPRAGTARYWKISIALTFGLSSMGVS